ncbi:MAG: hypothetical protein SPK75_03560 [Victivallales bacterium]|nr:hypothetical protein [Victivallales bacterium]
MAALARPRRQNPDAPRLGRGGNEFCAETTDSAPLVVIAANLIRNLDGSREFLESSPLNGDWHIYPEIADPAKLWDAVLADGPFISECGARCMPTPETWKKLLSQECFRAISGDTVYAPEKWRGSIRKSRISAWNIRKRCSAGARSSTTSKKPLHQNLWAKSGSGSSPTNSGEEAKILRHALFLFNGSDEKIIFFRTGKSRVYIRFWRLSNDKRNKSDPQRSGYAGLPLD